uniref:hypothetical protein n=1 Tax=Alicyclobacillus sp. SP_1 TaxID=2942475 RepID=UPI0021588D1B
DRRSPRMTVHEGNVIAALHSLLPKHRTAAAAYRAKRERVPEPAWDEPMLAPLDWERSARSVIFP